MTNQLLRNLESFNFSATVEANRFFEADQPIETKNIQISRFDNLLAVLAKTENQLRFALLRLKGHLSSFVPIKNFVKKGTGHKIS